MRTVESHVSSLLRKLRVADRRALAGLAGRMAHPPAPSGRFTGIPVSRTTVVGRSRDLKAAFRATEPGSSRRCWALGCRGIS